MKSFKDLAAVHEYHGKHGILKTADHFKETVFEIKKDLEAYSDQIKAYSASIDETTLLKLRGAAMRYAHSRGKNELAQDFASYVMIHRLTHATVDMLWAWVRFSKETFGDSETGPGRAELYANQTIVEIVEEPVNEFGLQVAGKLEHGVPDIVRMADEWGLEVIERVIFLLHFYQGQTLKEIQIILGFRTRKMGDTYKALLSKIRLLTND